MRAVIQRVKYAKVEVDGGMVDQIGNGLLLLLGIEQADAHADAEWLASKVAQMRIFGDENGLMNRSVLDMKGEVLVVSQFTLHASTQKGNRPSFIKAARPEFAVPLYKAFIELLEVKLGKKISTGIFGADMQISLLNDGPVTIIIDTKNKE